MLWKKLRKIPKNNGVIGHRKCPEIRKGARQKWFKFRALWFWRHVHDCMAGTEAGVPRVAGNWTCNIDSRHDIVKSSWKYRLLCCMLCDSRRDTVKWTPRRFVYFFVFGLLFRWGGNFLHFLRAFSRKAKSYDHRGVSRLLLGEARR